MFKLFNRNAVPLPPVETHKGTPFYDVTKQNADNQHQKIAEKVHLALENVIKKISDDPTLVKARVNTIKELKERVRELKSVLLGPSENKKMWQTPLNKAFEAGIEADKSFIDEILDTIPELASAQTLKLLNAQSEFIRNPEIKKLPINASDITSRILYKKDVFVRDAVRCGIFHLAMWYTDGSAAANQKTFSMINSKASQAGDLLGPNAEAIFKNETLLHLNNALRNSFILKRFLAKCHFYFCYFIIFPVANTILSRVGNNVYQTLKQYLYQDVGTNKEFDHIITTVFGRVKSFIENQNMIYKKIVTYKVTNIDGCIDDSFKEKFYNENFELKELYNVFAKAFLADVLPWWCRFLAPFITKKIGAAELLDTLIGNIAGESAQPSESSSSTTPSNFSHTLNRLVSGWLLQLHQAIIISAKNKNEPNKAALTNIEKGDVTKNEEIIYEIIRDLLKVAEANRSTKSTGSADEKREIIKKALSENSTLENALSGNGTLSPIAMAMGILLDSAGTEAKKQLIHALSRLSIDSIKELVNRQFIQQGIEELLNVINDSFLDNKEVSDKEKNRQQSIRSDIGTRFLEDSIEKGASTVAFLGLQAYAKGQTTEDSKQEILEMLETVKSVMISIEEDVPAALETVKNAVIADTEPKVVLNGARGCWNAFSRFNPFPTIYNNFPWAKKAVLVIKTSLFSKEPLTATAKGIIGVLNVARPSAPDTTPRTRKTLAERIIHLENSLENIKNPNSELIRHDLEALRLQLQVFKVSPVELKSKGIRKLELSLQAIRIKQLGAALKDIETLAPNFKGQIDFLSKAIKAYENLSDFESVNQVFGKIRSIVSFVEAHFTAEKKIAKETFYRFLSDDTRDFKNGLLSQIQDLKEPLCPETINSLIEDVSKFSIRRTKELELMNEELDENTKYALEGLRTTYYSELTKAIGKMQKVLAELKEKTILEGFVSLDNPLHKKLEQAIETVPALSQTPDVASHERKEVRKNAITAFDSIPALQPTKRLTDIIDFVANPRTMRHGILGEAIKGFLIHTGHIISKIPEKPVKLEDTIESEPHPTA